MIRMSTQAFSFEHYLHSSFKPCLKSLYLAPVSGVLSRTLSLGFCGDDPTIEFVLFAFSTLCGRST